MVVPVTVVRQLRLGVDALRTPSNGIQSTDSPLTRNGSPNGPYSYAAPRWPVTVSISGITFPLPSYDATANSFEGSRANRHVVLFMGEEEENDLVDFSATPGATTTIPGAGSALDRG